jgi:thiol-disulfide isomerase/thioredoxin
VSGAPTVEAAAQEARRGRRAGRAVLALAAAALVVNVVWIARHLDWLRPLEAGHPAPSFALTRLDGGGVVSDRDLRGKVVVLEFWATWCKPCLASLPRVNEAARRWAGRAEVLAVNLDDAGKAAALFERSGYRMTLVGDDGDTSMRYQVDVLPHVVVIDGDGVVRMVGQGGGGVRDAEAAVERLLSDP